MSGFVFGGQGAQNVPDCCTNNADVVLRGIPEFGFDLFRDLRRKMITEDIMRRQHSRDISFATPAQVRAFYDKNIDRFRTVGKVDVSMITLAKTSEIAEVTPEMRRKLSQEIYNKLKKGADFAETAKKLSDDPMAEKGGHRGVIDTSGSTFPKDLTVIG